MDEMYAIHVLCIQYISRPGFSFFLRTFIERLFFCVESVNYLDDETNCLTYVFLNHLKHHVTIHRKIVAIHPF